MAHTFTPEIRMLAPSVLGLETRNDFRQDATRLLEEHAPGDGRFVIDLSPTRDVDSAGLGELMAVGRLAIERGLEVALRNPTDEIRYLLTLTKLDELFVITEE
ncbi:MAG: STAS domain-containing protein [Gemmatimonadales bacterium]|nr:STAS domain-containing protein [Gemmatimonadales bacterium]